MTEFLSSDQALPDTRDQVFVDEYVRTGDPRLACVRAGITDPKYPMSVLARRMLDRADIQEAVRLAQERVANAEPVEITRDSIVADLDKVFDDALDAGNHAAAVSAKKAQAQMLGFLETTLNVKHSMTVTDLSDDKLAEIAAGKPVVIEGQVVRRQIEGIGGDA